MATDPQFATTPRLAQVQISTANTGRDGTGTLGTLIAGVATGTKIEEIRIVATGTTTAGMVRMFLDDGANIRLLDEFAVYAATPSGTVGAFQIARRYDNLILPSTAHVLKFGTHNAETFNVFAHGADF
jgi:hypothetical protein